MLKYFVIILLFSQNVAAEKAVITDVEPINTNVATSYQIQKLETLINELRIEVTELRAQIIMLDKKQITLSNKLESISPKEDQEVVDAHLNENMSEFKYGFEMLQQGNYDIAKRSFELFIEKYPEDLKLGEAYFWLGEIAYKAEDYNNASKNYLISYRDYANNPRRNDSLFKLSIVLSIAKKMEEACTGFEILLDPNLVVSESLRNKAKDELVTLACKIN
ncbi:MAG: tetratricopeptide repeat protein [Alphaproteobacteria bacterium]|jgi:tol-pal system protein YbgF|nr:tetratricopeptide repeat protein [Alphaproteobacteria bacterium]MBT5828521.1 tetratricopeptide repeat protein [Alphaproteobacteria bacterium]